MVANMMKAELRVKLFMMLDGTEIETESRKDFRWTATIYEFQ